MLTLVVIAIVIGFVLFLTSNPLAGSMNATVNIFAQTLPTSIAEVVICWAVVGIVFESLVRSKMHGKGNDPNSKNGTVLHLNWTSIRRKVTTVSVLSLLVGGIVSVV